MDNLTILDDLSILYVEDDSLIRAGIADFLRRRTSQLYLAENGQEGLDTFIKCRPDIVITDILMPVMDGLQMAQEIKALDPNVPIIVTTAFNESDLFIKAIDIGIDKYILKPLDRTRLLQSLKEVAWQLSAYKKLKLSSLAFQESSEGIMITDTNNQIVFVNPAFTTITGYQSQDVIGFNPNILSSNKQDKKFYTALWQTLSDTGHWQGEIINRKKNGEYYTEWLNLTQIRDQHGTPLYQLGLFSNISQHKENKLLQHLVGHDALTDLPNRSLFIDRITNSLQLAKRHSYELSVLFIDLDNFKVINDTLGHEIGDLLLQDVAQQLSSCIRETDTVARFGGDEFVVLLGHIEHGKDAAKIAKDIITRLTADFSIKSHLVHIGCSIGISAYPADGDTPDILLKNADIAMYQAKRKGGNQYDFFTPAMDMRLLKTTNMEEQLQQALNKDEFKLRYQLVVNLANQQIDTLEASFFWQHPALGVINADQLIPTIKKMGRLDALSKLILRKAVEQTNTCKKTQPNLSLSITIFDQQLKSSGFLAVLDQVFTETNFPPADLELKLTETCCINLENKYSPLFNLLHSLGIRICITDFGIGYLSSERLKKLYATRLKIAPSLLADRNGSIEENSIISSIMAIANSMNIDILIEDLDYKNCAVLMGLYQDITLYSYQKHKPMSFEQLQYKLQPSS